MDVSSALCRAQQLLHEKRAAETPLKNVRAVSTRAAIAWGIEAIAAERRQQRRPAPRLIEMAGMQARADEMAWTSENPDRGYATPGMDR